MTETQALKLAAAHRFQMERADALQRQVESLRAEWDAALKYIYDGHYSDGAGRQCSCTHCKLFDAARGPGGTQAMTATEVKALTDRELDAGIATTFFGKEPSRSRPSNNKGYFDLGSPTHWEWRPKFFSTDRNAAALVLERIGELDLVHDFVVSMASVIYPQSACRIDLQLPKIAFAFISASPRLLMEAALLAWEESK